MRGTIAIATALLAAAIIVGAIMSFWSSVFHEPVDFNAPPGVGNPPSPGRRDDDPYAVARRRMVEEQLLDRDITDPKVLDAMGQVARERFVSPSMRKHAYEDRPLPIGLGQTISQPYIVALMAQEARLSAESRVLEIGVGSGYQAAVLAGLCKEVYGVEILEPLAVAARDRLASLGYKNVAVRFGDGYQGWSEHAPFDAILVAAAPEHVPKPLIDQLAPGGRLVIPVGGYYQELLLIEKRADGSLHRTTIAPVQFVPMTGEAEESRNL